MSHTIQWYRRKLLPPAAPAAPSISSATASSLVVTWAAVTGATQYTLQRSPDGVTGWTQVFQGAATSFTDSPLTTGATFYYRVRADTPRAGSSGWSPVGSGVTSGTTQPPATPTTAPTMTDQQATALTIAYDAVAGATSYILQRSPDGTTGWTTVSTAPDLSVTDGGLTASTNYWYRYAAVNSDGQSPGWSPSLAASTLAALTAPSTPAAAPTVTSAGTDTLTVSWSTVARASSYTLQRSVNGTTGWTQVSTGTGTSFTDTGRTAATAYYYRFSATNSAGTSGFSPVGSATTDAAGTTTAQPVSALAFTSRCGQDIHANFNTAVWQYGTEIIDRLASTGVTYVRGQCNPDLALMKEYAAALKANNMKWLMGIVEAPRGALPTQTTQETINRVKGIAADPLFRDLCVGFEGVNEINYQTVNPTADWVTPAMNHQKAIYNTARSFTAFDNVPILGPPMQAPHSDNRPADWTDLATAGILSYQDIAAVHSYPNAINPTNLLQKRLNNMRAAYGAGYPAWVTESGYTNNLGGTGNPTTEKTASIYTPRGYLQMILDFDVSISYFEVMDDPDAGPVLDREKHWGWWRVPSLPPANWSEKPVAGTVRGMLTHLADPAGTSPYTPSKVTLRVSTTTADVKWHVLATKAQSDAGTATVFIYRNVLVNQTGNTEAEVTVSPVSVSITDRVGTRTFQVDAYVQAIDLR